MEKIPEEKKGKKEKIRCSSCGAEMDADSAACLKCGSMPTGEFNYLEYMRQQEVAKTGEKPRPKPEASPAGKTRKIGPAGPTRKLEE